MSASQFDEFERRMRRISRRHSKMSQGFVTAVTEDGLVVARPKRQRRNALLRGLIVILLIVIPFKGFLHARLGPEAYEARIEALSSGTVFEQAGAYAMTADPLTVWISDQLVSLVR